MKNLLTILLSVLSLYLNAQTPTGFSYQAVLRNAQGEVMANQSASLRVTITGSNDVDIHYQEEHAVQSSAQGLVGVIIGTGTNNVGNLVDVPWGTDQLKLKLEIKLGSASTYSFLGTQTLQAVPYALHASNAKTIESSPSASDEEPIFVVKNKLGQIVFAVYQEGVRVYVDNGSTVSKGLKGGFAIGGLSGTKESVEYFRITPDSARIYIDDTGKGLKGGFAIGGLSGTKLNSDYLLVTPDSTRVYIDDSGKRQKGGFAIGGLSGTKVGKNYFDVSTDTLGVINPGQKRVLWYPIKNAFLAGQVLIESPDSVGENSFATGYESKSIGMYSQAMGYNAKAAGNYSTAIGKYALAKADNSFAFGDSVIASTQNSYAFGKKSKSTGVGSFSLGYECLASGNNALAVGTKTVSSFESSVAMGYESVASNWYSFAMGWGSVASGAFSVALSKSSATSDYDLAIGNQSVASGGKSVAIGYKNNSTALYSIAIGSENTASGQYAVAIGSAINAKGIWSVSTGYGTKTEGIASFTAGWSNISKGFAASAFGTNTLAKAYASFVIGQYNDTSCISSSEWNSSDPLFIVGNGSGNNSRSNAFAVYKNGNIDVEGSVSMPIATVNANTTLGDGYYTVLVDAAPVTINLPTASSCPGRIYIIKKITSNIGSVIVDAFSNETIDGLETQSINAQWSKMIVQSNGSGWFLIN